MPDGMSPEQETAMYDQPERVDISGMGIGTCDKPEPHTGHTWIDKGKYEEEDETVLCLGRLEDARGRNVSPFAQKVLGFLEAAGATYEERNAVYQDNFLVVGRVMEALFPNGAPALHDQHDFNRWHIFELAIVKLTRYVANWQNPDPDSLVDMLPYLSILAAQDQELRERIQRQIDDQIEENRLVLKFKDSAKRAGFFVNDTGPNYEADMVDDEARRITENEAFEREGIPSEPGIYKDSL